MHGHGAASTGKRRERCRLLGVLGPVPLLPSPSLARLASTPAGKVERLPLEGDEDAQGARSLHSGEAGRCRLGAVRAPRVRVRALTRLGERTALTRRAVAPLARLGDTAGPRPRAPVPCPSGSPTSLASRPPARAGPSPPLTSPAQGPLPSLFWDGPRFRLFLTARASLTRCAVPSICASWIDGTIDGKIDGGTFSLDINDLDM